MAVAELELKAPPVRRDAPRPDLDLAGVDDAGAGVGELELDRQVGEAVGGHRHLAARRQGEVEERPVVGVAADRRLGVALRADRHLPRHQLQAAGRGQPGRDDVQSPGVAGLVARPDVDPRLGLVGGRGEQVEAGEAGVGTEADHVDLVGEAVAAAVAQEDRPELVVGREDVLPAVEVGVGDADVEQALAGDVGPHRRGEARLRGRRQGRRRRRDGDRARTADQGSPTHTGSVIGRHCR